MWQLNVYMYISTITSKENTENTIYLYINWNKACGISIKWKCFNKSLNKTRLTCSDCMQQSILRLKSDKQVCTRHTIVTHRRLLFRSIEARKPIAR